MKPLMKLCIYFYRLALSPMLGRNCRFHPTCSAYALEAIELHGAWRGGCMALRRIGKCHPFYKGDALDPVPGPQEKPKNRKIFLMLISYFLSAPLL